MAEGLAVLRESHAKRWPYAAMFELGGVQYHPFSRLVVPSDVDGHVHCRESNRHLFLEGKTVGERDMSAAQRESLEGLSRAGHDVLLFWATPDEVPRVVMMEHLLHDPARREAGQWDFIVFLSQWWDWAKTAPRRSDVYSGFGAA